MILSTPGTSDCRLSYKQVIRAVPQKKTDRVSFDRGDDVFIKLVCGVGQDVLEERAEMGMTDKIGGAASDDGGQETDTGAAGDVALARLE